MVYERAVNPLAQLPPEAALAYLDLRYIACATLCLWFWNFVTDIDEDVTLISVSGLSLKTVCYIMSKLTTAATVLCQFLITILPINNCRLFAKLLTAVIVTEMQLNRALFLFRIRATFKHSPNVHRGFLIFWLVEGIACFVSVISSDAIHIGTTKYCLTVNKPALLCVGMIVTLLLDTAMLVAIMIHTLTYTLPVGSGAWEKLKALFNPPFTYQIGVVILQRRQVYFLALLFTDCLALVATFASSLPTALRICFELPLEAIMNIISCKAYIAVELQMTPGKVTMFNSQGQAMTLQFSEHPSFVARPGEVQPTAVRSRRTRTSDEEDASSCGVEDTELECMGGTSQGHQQLAMDNLPGSSRLSET